MAFLQQVLGVPVVGAERAVGRVLRRDQRQQRLEVAGRGPLADEEVHPAAQLLPRLLELGGLVIRADARRRVGVERRPRQPRRMPVHRPVAGGLDLGQHLGHAQKDAGVVHHLGQADDARVFEKQPQIGRLQLRTRGLHVGGRHTGRGHDEDPQRQPLAGVEHVADAGDAQHVGDLVGIGDDGGGAARHDGPGELGHGHHARLDVDVGVDQAGADVGALQVERLTSLVVTEPGHAPFEDGDVGAVDLARPHIHEPGVSEERVGRRIAARHLDQPSSRLGLYRFSHGPSSVGLSD